MKPLLKSPIHSSFSLRAAYAMASRSETEIFVSASEEELAISLAEYTANLSEKFVKERGAFSVVLSGGSLIKALRKLTESPYLESVDWKKWYVFWADERVVPKDHVDSNYKLAYDGLLSKVPVLPGHVCAINDSLSAKDAAVDYESHLRQYTKTGVIDTSSTEEIAKFDVMLLGMGPDGHVASLFPGHPLVKEEEKWVTFIEDSPKPPPERITLTFPVINASANIALVAMGAGKADVVSSALGSGENSEPQLPVQMVSLKDGKLVWFADREAASKL